MSPEAFQDISGSSQINPITGRSRPCTKVIIVLKKAFG
jgi:hypothetical protein